MINTTKHDKHIVPKEKHQKIFNEPEQTYTLKREKDEKELRIELGLEDIIKITVSSNLLSYLLNKLVSGTAEIEGAEIPLNVSIYRKNINFAIYTWKEAEIKVYHLLNFKRFKEKVKKFIAQKIVKWINI